jgi:hypothetical protein
MMNTITHLPTNVSTAGADYANAKVDLFALVAFLPRSIGVPTEFEKNRQTWQDSGITHYRFSLNIGCFCAFQSNAHRC